MSTSVRVAILGGGLAGASLIHALLPHNHLDVHIFESASAFKEAGIAIGFAWNALDALALIGPLASSYLNHVGTVSLQGVRFMLAEDDNADSIIDETKEGKYTTSIVYYAAFLKELLADVSMERMHASKKLNRFNWNYNDFITLHFNNRTIYDCDIFIGADGIYSAVRKLILDKDNPAIFPRNTGA